MNIDLRGSLDILDQFKTISNKLTKKRFLRKPNVTEASESFTSLGQQCENIEMPCYAGMCWIAAARCEGSLGNITGETSCLIRSARNFSTAEMKNKALGCPSIANENLQAAISCYTHARTRLPEHCPLATGIQLEVVNLLQKLGVTHSVETYLKEALELSSDSVDIKLICLELLAADFIQKGDYASALDTYTESANLLELLPKTGARSDLLLNCEICRVFLLLILRPTPHKLPQHFTKLLENFTWGDKKSSCMSEELFLLLQSLVITCQSLDTSSLAYLEAELWSHLKTNQKSLLRSLVLSYS